MKTHRRISPDDVKAFLEPWYDDIVSSFEEAFARYKTNPDVLDLDHPRTRANFIWSVWTSVFERKVNGRPGIRISRPRGSFHVHINDKVVFRFKKFDANGMSSNVPTQATFSFLYGQLDLPGVDPAAAKLEVGYRLDRGGLQKIDLAVACRADGWSYIIPERVAEVKTMPLPRQQKHVQTRITPKAGMKLRKKDSGDGSR